MHYHTLRHWKAKTKYHKIKDILHVTRLLGHKSINNMLIYTHVLEVEQSDEYSSAIANTMEQVQTLIESRFEYVTEIDNMILFRKRK